MTDRTLNELSIKKAYKDLYTIIDGCRVRAVLTDTAVNSSDSTNLIITVPATGLFEIDYDASGSQSGKCILYESPTFEGGDAVTQYNRNRNNSDVSGLTIVKGATISDNGTQIGLSKYFGSSGVASTKGAGNERTRSSWILKNSTSFN